MKLNQEFLVHNTTGESLLVPTGKAPFSGIVRGNRTLGVLFSLLEKETTENELVSAMKERFQAPEGAIEEDVARMLSELRRIGALDE